VRAAEAVKKACDLLKPGDFFSDAHAEIFGAIQSLVARGTAADLVTVYEELKQRGATERAAALLDKVHALEAEAQRLGRKAEREGDVRTALLALREYGRALELLGRLTGVFKPETAPGGVTVIFQRVTLTTSERLALPAAAEDACPPHERCPR